MGLILTIVETPYRKRHKAQKAALGPAPYGCVLRVVAVVRIAGHQSQGLGVGIVDLRSRRQGVLVWRPRTVAKKKPQIITSRG